LLIEDNPYHNVVLVFHRALPDLQDLLKASLRQIGKPTALRGASSFNQSSSSLLRLNEAARYRRIFNQQLRRCSDCLLDFLPFEF
jgi:hypothetical protein